MNKTDLSSATEEQLLLQRLREGDMGSYETLFHRYYPTFFAFAKGMLKDAGAAEDIICIGVQLNSSIDPKSNKKSPFTTVNQKLYLCTLQT